ncbi:MAG: heterocyst frequency control protein PatD [Cyanobacteria bacterium J06631_2]
MLPASHDRAYQDFMTLLTRFRTIAVVEPEKIVLTQIPQEFQSMQNWFEQNIAQLGDRYINPELLSRWQAVQTEIKREFKLLSTDILFLATSRQQTTRQKRLKSIEERLTKLIGYCQVMLQDNN